MIVGQAHAHTFTANWIFFLIYVATRHMAIEVLLTLVESRPGMMRKVPNFLARLLNVIVQMMLTLEEQSLDVWNNDIVSML